MIGKVKDRWTPRKAWATSSEAWPALGLFEEMRSANRPLVQPNQILSAALPTASLSFVILIVDMTNKISFSFSTILNDFWGHKMDTRWTPNGHKKCEGWGNDE